MPSAVIAAYHYNTVMKTLEVHYHSGKVYQYLNVPEKVFEETRTTMVKGI
jgi:cytochrome c2